MTATSISGAFDGAAVRRALNRWYRVNGRHNLAWRLTRDPYAILVSEVMLQQTQVERVLPYWQRWMTRWPSLSALAEASPAEVIREWQGLGYNRRAIALHRTAVVAVAQGPEGLHPGAHLRDLPGIGPYTESAIRCFAWDERVPVADTNIARVVARTAFGVAHQRELPAKELTEMLTGLLPAHAARAHNLGLMDLGAMVCTARSPGCESCPVAEFCQWRATGYPPAAAIGKPAPRFESTARYARGRIIDALREAPATGSQLRELLPEAHRVRLETYLRSLERDGLVVPAGATWRLPG